ncbi:DUF6862 domain-containing protein, partial [Amphibiibacter pelophylacis]
NHHRRGNMLNMSEVEQFQKASESCSKTGDPDACGKVRELTRLSQSRDRQLGGACGPEANQAKCDVLVRDAISKGNIVKGQYGEFTWADSPKDSFPLNVVIAGPPSEREDFHSRAARSTATGTLLLLPGPEDFVLGAVLATKTGQMIAEAALVGGQKVWRFVDGTTANFGSKEAEAISRARVENNANADAGFAGDVPVRPRDGKISVGIAQIDTPIGRHLIEGVIRTNRKGLAEEISGGHNMENFKKSCKPMAVK